MIRRCGSRISRWPRPCWAGHPRYPGRRDLSGHWLISGKRYTMHNRPPLKACLHLITCLRSLLLLAILLGSASLSPVSAQISEAEARMLLAERGIPEDTLRARLIRRGSDPDNIDPDQMEAFQSEILAVIAEIDEENQELVVP